MCRFPITVVNRVLWSFSSYGTSVVYVWKSNLHLKFKLSRVLNAVSDPNMVTVQFMIRKSITTAELVQLLIRHLFLAIGHVYITMRKDWTPTRPSTHQVLYLENEFTVWMVGKG